jgi:MFS family permease
MIYQFLVKEFKILKERPKIASILKQEFKKRNTQIVSLFLFVSSVGYGLLVFVIPLFMKTVLHMEIGQIGLVTTIYPVTMVIGSLIGGAMADRWSRKIVLFIFCSALIVSAALIFANTWQILAMIYGIIGFLNGGYLSSSSALMMDISNPEIGTTQYSILASICNFGEFGMESISGYLITILGFSHIFLYSAWFCGPSLLLLYFIRLKKSDIH